MTDIRSSTETLILAMRVLSRDIVTDDGVANAAIAEAAERLKELNDVISTFRTSSEMRYIILEKIDEHLNEPHNSHILPFNKKELAFLKSYLNIASDYC